MTDTGIFMQQKTQQGKLRQKKVVDLYADETEEWKKKLYNDKLNDLQTELMSLTSAYQRYHQSENDSIKLAINIFELALKSKYLYLKKFDTDNGEYIENIDLDILESSDYACGLFVFTKI